MESNSLSLKFLRNASFSSFLWHSFSREILFTFYSMRAQFASSPFRIQSICYRGQSLAGSCSDKQDLRAQPGHWGVVPWLRINVPGQFETHKAAERLTRKLNRISDFVNGSLFYLEKLHSFLNFAQAFFSKCSELIRLQYEFCSSFSERLVVASGGRTSVSSCDAGA